ncbi:hypothetical protein OG21DRAFT_1450626 [Imleria badia]|nr:hypothetical protein OG21DRAFT_1450626 [Imleria badia]
MCSVCCVPSHLSMVSFSHLWTPSLLAASTCRLYISLENKTLWLTVSRVFTMTVCAPACLGFPSYPSNPLGICWGLRLFDLTRTMSRQPRRELWSLSRLLYERAIALGMALERSSAAAYNSHLNLYLTFCRIHNRPVTPTVDTLSFFIVYMSAHIRPDSVVVYLAGICNRLESEFPDVRQHHAHPLVKCTLASCLRRGHQQPSRKPPLTLTILHDVLSSSAQTALHDDLLFSTLVATDFYALMRLGELVWPDTIALQSFCKVILQFSLRIDHNSYSFTLPTHKSLKVGHGSNVLIRSFAVGADPCPFCVNTCVLATISSLLRWNFGSPASDTSLPVCGSLVVFTRQLDTTSRVIRCALVELLPSL